MAKLFWYRDERQAHLLIGADFPCTIWGKSIEVVDKNLNAIGWKRCARWRPYKWGKQTIVCKAK